MALNLDSNRSAFASKFSKVAAPVQEKSMLWINIGYQTDVADAEGKPVFVSLARGIALDQIPDQPTNSSNEGFAHLRAAQNDLRDQLLAAAAKLAPGETKIVDVQLQIRRVNEETTVDLSQNPLAKKLFAVE